MVKLKSIKVIKKLNTYLNKWLKDHNFDCTVKYSSDFSYDPLNEVISYSFLVVDDHEKLFFDFCKALLPELISCDNFILSFFHELGHYITDDDFSEQEYQDYLNFDLKLNSIIDKTILDYLSYYNLPIELIATKWGCQFIVDNSEEVMILYKRIQELELEYLKALKEEI